MTATNDKFIEEVDKMFNCSADRTCIYLTKGQWGWFVTQILKYNKWITELKKLAVMWHKYPDEKPPIDGRYLFWDSDGNAPHVLPYNDIVVRDNPGVFSTQTHWAYLPEPPEDK